jgi:hypothetical protein
LPPIGLGARLAYKMTVREETMAVLREAPDEVVAEALDYLRFLLARSRGERFGTAIASEPALRKDWDTPEEDEAWKSL